MIRHLKVTVLVDNISDREDAPGEHGLSLWIEADGNRILYDAGQSELLLRNAKALNIDLRKADMLVLSHGHYDHTGAVAAIVAKCKGIAVYGHPGILLPRYSCQQDGTMKSVGCNREAGSALQSIFDTIRWVNKPTGIKAGFGLSGPIPRRTSFEDTGGAFFLDAAASRPDLIDDDLALWFSTPQGLVVITGCCHAGIVNTLTYIREITDNQQVHAVIGGYHLLNASASRISLSGDYIAAAGIDVIVPCHCTGAGATGYLQERFGEKVVPGKVGYSYEFKGG